MTSSPSPGAALDVLCIGNAIVDVIARADDGFLARHGIVKGGMTLIDEARAELLSVEALDATTASGGSAANTAVGAASLGSASAFIGKVKADRLGALYASDLAATGVVFPTAAAQEGPATARSFIFVTPDAQRSMNTYLGACQNLTPADIEPDVVRSARVTYLEGYLWDPPLAKDAFRRAAAIAHEAGRQVAITLSDSFCVARYRAEFLELIRSAQVDIVFANEHELESLYEAPLADAVERLRAEAALGVVTRSDKGALAVRGADTAEVPARPPARLVDTTGAGDLFASGFLHGHVRGLPLRASLELGALAAAEVISHVGPRPATSLRGLAEEAGLAA